MFDNLPVLLAVTLALFTCIIALIKVALIAMFFMHLKFEGKWIFGVVVLAIVAISILIFLIAPDIGAVGGVRH